MLCRLASTATEYVPILLATSPLAGDAVGADHHQVDFSPRLIRNPAALSAIQASPEYCPLQAPMRKPRALQKSRVSSANTLHFFSLLRPRAYDAERGAVSGGPRARRIAMGQNARRRPDQIGAMPAHAAIGCDIRSVYRIAFGKQQGSDCAGVPRLRPASTAHAGKRPDR